MKVENTTHVALLAGAAQYVTKIRGRDNCPLAEMEQVEQTVRSGAIGGSREMDMPSKNQIQLTVVVNGEPTIVEANVEAPLRTVIPKALHQTGNSGQPPENWELRDTGGTLLELDAKIETFNFTPESRLFLNLKAGIGGHGQPSH